MTDFRLRQEEDGVVSTQIIERQRTELINLLDRATDGWMDFMLRVGQYLGEATAGRPSKKKREGSMLGILGFETWREMIEAERENGGLGWSYSTWQQWQKAFNVIKKYPLLPERKLTPAEINRFNADAKKTAISRGEVNEKGKPIQQPTLEAWDEAVQAAQEEKKAVKAEKELQVRKDLTEASQKLSEAEKRLATLSVELDAEKRLRASYEAQISELREQVAKGTEATTCLTKTLSEKDADLKRIAAERNEARNAVSSWKEKAAQLNKEVKTAKGEISSLTSRMKKIKSLSLIDRIFKWDK